MEQEIIIKIGAQDNASATVEQIGNELKSVTQQLSEMAAAGQEGSKAFQELTAKQKALTEQATAYDKLPLEDKMNITKKRMVEMAAAGKQNTAEFRALAAEASKMKRAIEGVEQTVQMMAVNGSRGMAVFTEAVTAMSGGMAVAQGVAGLFGDENEDLQKSMMKVQSAMALAFGVQQIINTLTQRSILLTEAYAAAQKLLAWTTNASTAAMRTFRAALVTTGIGALVVGLGLLIEAMMNSSKETKEATDVMERYNKEIERAAAKNAAADEAIKLMTAQMKLQGKTEAQITLEIYKHLKAREAEMLMDEAAAKTALETAKVRADALKMEIAAKKAAVANDAQRGGAGGKWAKEQTDLIVKAQTELDALLANIKKADAAIKSMEMARKLGLVEAQTAYTQALKSEADAYKTKEQERKDIMEEAYKALLKDNERELREFDTATEAKLKKFEAGSQRRLKLEKQYAEQRRLIVERQTKDVAEADKAAEAEKLSNAIAAEDARINMLIGKAKTSGKNQNQIATEIEALEIKRLQKQIELTKQFCLDTAALEGQLQDTILANKEAAYVRELDAIQKHNAERNAELLKGANDAQTAAAMQTALELEMLEQQLEIARKYGKETADIEAAIAQIKLNVTEQVIQDGKRRVDAARAVQRELEKVNKTERQLAKQDLKNAKEDSAKAFEDDKKMYEDMYAAGLIDEADYSAAINELREERRTRDLSAELSYREKLKTLQSTYAVQEIQYAQQALNALTQMRQAELDAQIQQAEHAKEDEILALDVQLKNKIITEEFYQQQKASITDKYDKEAEKYERDKFELDKAAAISNALISTYLAGVQVLAATKGGTIARFIAMAATITAGLAQVTMISKQKFRGRTAGRMSAAASLPDSQPEPNQLISNPQTTNLGSNGQTMPPSGGGGQQTAGGRNAAAPEPLRAYVVERDITETGARVRQLSEFATLQ